MPGKAADQKTTVEKIVAQTIAPLMARYGIPGMAVGIVAAGQSDVYNYGIASKATGKPVSNDTLFEIGSISKTLHGDPGFLRAGRWSTLLVRPG